MQLTFARVAALTLFAVGAGAQTTANSNQFELGSLMIRAQKTGQRWALTTFDARFWSERE